MHVHVNATVGKQVFCLCYACRLCAKLEYVLLYILYLRILKNNYQLYNFGYRKIKALNLSLNPVQTQAVPVVLIKKFASQHDSRIKFHNFNKYFHQTPITIGVFTSVHLEKNKRLDYFILSKIK